MLTGCTPVPFNDLAALEQALRAGDVAAFIAEPIQGNGVILPHDGYLQGAAALCRRHGALFIADEVLTGCGRTGRFLAVEHWAVEPDIIVLAKALCGGQVPIGAVLMRKWIFDKLFARSAHGSTFSKNDLAMAAGLATLDVLSTERLVENADHLGRRLIQSLAAMAGRHNIVSAVRGKGMMIGIQFKLPRSLFARGLMTPLLRTHRILTHLTGPAGDTLRLLPPLIVNEQDCSRIEGAFAQIVTELLTAVGPESMGGIGQA
jgi:ornithine--oxo-acid transaminase